MLKPLDNPCLASAEVWLISSCNLNRADGVHIEIWTAEFVRLATGERYFLGEFKRTSSGSNLIKMMECAHVCDFVDMKSCFLNRQVHTKSYEYINTSNAIIFLPHNLLRNQNGPLPKLIGVSCSAPTWGFWMTHLQLSNKGSWTDRPATAVIILRTIRHGATSSAQGMSPCGERASRVEFLSAAQQLS